MTAQPHRHEVHQLAVSLQIVLFRRQGQRVAARLPARDDGNQVHLVAVGQDVPDDGVTRLVDGDHALGRAASPWWLRFSGPICTREIASTSVC